MIFFFILCVVVVYVWNYGSTGFNGLEFDIGSIDT